ncbi:ATP-binding protein [Nocardioides dongkuii]|uniref:ATP-binding protein n=1 Tax=Nocardioides dongkuii TaxID=2760089 RepID=UPI0015FE67EB|nr:ATP-binding protein [Nocardioides dongkuii]
MTRSSVLRVALLLAATALFGCAAVLAAPDDGYGIGIWPVGLATTAALLARGRQVAAVVVTVLVTAVLTIAWVRPTEVALGFGLGIAVETVVVWWLLTGGRPGPTGLRTDEELSRFFVAGGAGGAVAAVAGALTSLLTGWGDPWLVALTLASAHLASQLTVVPLFARLPHHGPTAGSAERVAQWLVVAVVTPLVFLPHDFPSVVFLAVPVLAWGAIRLAPREAVLQMGAVLGFAITMTTLGLGPFAAVPEAFGLPVDARGILLATFASTCAGIVVPLVVRSGVHLETAREAAAERDRMRNIVDGTQGVAIIGTDERGLITLFNPGAERLLGYQRDEVLGESTRRLHSDEAVARKAEELGVDPDFDTVVETIMDRELVATELGFLRKDGEERSHAMTLARVSDERGHVVGYVSTSEDITERLRTQGALEEAVERLREVDAVKDVFVSSVSHELRTPITSILGYLEMLEDGSYGELTPLQRDAVRRVSGNSGRLLALIDDLLTLSRMADSSLGATEKVLDLRAVVRSGYDVVVPVAKSKRLRLSIDLPEEPVPVLGDPDLVERVVVNLVGNAVKFTPAGGTVQVAMTVDGETAELTVADSGIGIPEEDHERLFTRFFRTELAQRNAIQGSGLGLSIARGAVEKHGGTVTVTSAVGEGTTFCVRLPVVA